MTSQISRVFTSTILLYTAKNKKTYVNRILFLFLNKKKNLISVLPTL